MKMPRDMRSRGERKEIKMKPLDKECTEQSCWCHTELGHSNKAVFIESLHREDNAVEAVKELAEKFVEVAAPIARWGGDCEYDGAMETFWRHVCEVRGLTAQWLDATTVEEKQIIRKSPRKPRRKKISDRTRLRIYARDGYACVSCGVNNDLTLDHVLALANGGGDEEENLQTMCRSCNVKKGVKPWVSGE